MYACMYVYIYVCTYVYIYICLYIYMYACMYVCMRTFILGVPHTVLVYNYLRIWQLELRKLCHLNYKN